MRHASSPRMAPDEQTVNPDNVKPERQLDAACRVSATEAGKEMREMKLPIRDILSSPAYRARETVRFAQFNNAQIVEELGDNGQSMQGVTEAQFAWLRKRVTQFPAGTNTIIVTHLPKLTGAFPRRAAGIEDGETLVLGPDGKGGARLVARLKIGEWARMKASAK